jgi:hypothetical protein
MKEETKKPNNPNAFPTDLDIQKETEIGYYYQTGMTLLDYFAAKALPQIIANYQRERKNIFEYPVCENAYTIAELMLKEREKHI